MSTSALPTRTAAPTRRPATDPTGHAPGRDLPLLGFFVAAYLLPWTVWASRIAQDHGLLSWHLPGGIALWTLLPVTLVALAATGGRAALAEHGRRLLRWKLPAGTWALALGLPVALAGLAVLTGLAAGGHLQLGVTLGAGPALAYLAVGVPLFCLTEESAWRGFALPRLMIGRSPLAAALVLGVVWAGWHLPTFFLSEENDSAVPYAGFAVMTVATSVLTAWLYLRSRGSLLLLGAFHAVTDAVYSWTGVVGSDHHAFWAAVVLHVLLAAALAPGLRQLPRSQAHVGASDC
jgi:membrane protease YdiL (CAAX protease family)